MIHIIAVALLGRNPAGRCVRLLQEAQLLQIGHFIADRGRTEPHITTLGNAAGAYRLSRTDIVIHYGA
ncbi:hypothetical protein D3C73_1372530 [compost metagenome]